MLHSSFLNFLFLLLHRHRSKHVGIFLITSVLVFLFASVMLLAGALQRDLSTTIDGQADLTVQKIRSGQRVDLPMHWVDELASIHGVSAALPRVYGSYYHESNREYFTILGLDFFDEQSTQLLDTLVADLDLREFLKEPSMILGRGVREFLTAKHYSGTYEFFTPDRDAIDVRIMGELPEQSRLISNDIVLMDLDLARQVLGVKDFEATDIILKIPNELERTSVMAKVIERHFDVRVISKDELQTALIDLFNYKSGLFLLLYIVVLFTFALILFQRYSMISGSERREIGILRAVGWSISDVLKLKFLESAVVGSAAFLLGLLAAWLYVFPGGAPLLRNVFLGSANLPVDLDLTPWIPASELGLLFLFTLLPFLAAVLIPVWKTAITDPSEVMK
jgi:putative ABC transport system permease protein